jgi:hypothetical protein
LLHTGFANGPQAFWDGPGIDSSVAASDTGHHLGVGAIDNTQSSGTLYTGFGNQPVGPNCILIHTTLIGATDLQNTVNLDDLNRFAADFGTPTNAGWYAGDFEYNGTVNLDDLNSFAANFGSSIAGYAPSVAPAGDATIALADASTSTVDPAPSPTRSDPTDPMVVAPDTGAATVPVVGVASVPAMPVAALPIKTTFLLTIAPAAEMAMPAGSPVHAAANPADAKTIPPSTSVLESFAVKAPPPVNAIVNVSSLPRRSNATVSDESVSAVIGRSEARQPAGTLRTRDGRSTGSAQSTRPRRTVAAPITARNPGPASTSAAALAPGTANVFASAMLPVIPADAALLGKD